MSVAVAAIAFNHDPGSSVDSALNIRKNATQAAAASPEWQLGRPAGANAPAAYALARLGRPLRVKAEFRSVDPAVRAVEIRAIDRPADELEQELAAMVDPRSIWWLQAYFTTLAQYQAFHAYVEYYNGLLQRYWQIRLSTPGNALGEVRPATIRFDAAGRSGPVMLDLDNVQLGSRGVGVYPISWRWQFRRAPAAPWSDAGLTQHTIYVVLDEPTSPWEQTPFVVENLQLPWTDVLDWACRWAAGARDAETVARRITEQVNALGRATLTYSCPVLGAEMYASTLFDWFNCTAFLDRLAGGPGNGQFVNCTDCATIVSTFANALGCDLSQSRMGEYDRIFETNPVITIGSQQWQLPCQSWQGFVYHEVAWTGGGTATDTVYDAALSVGDSLGSRSGRALLPAGMRFGEPGDGNYRDRLAVPASRITCRPRPEERRRRQVF